MIRLPEFTTKQTLAVQHLESAGREFNHYLDRLTIAIRPP
jgi:hypothetical protein